MQKTKTEINWKMAKDHVEEIFPRLDSELEDALSDLSLRNSKHFLLTENYPPRLSLCFIPRGIPISTNNWITKTIYNCELFPEAERELKKNQVEISEVVSKLAEKYNLNAFGGALYGDKWYHSLGLYTFKLNYSDFIMEERN